MGMFDTIYCDAALPDGFADEVAYQTKCLECAMSTFRITTEGRLVKIHDGFLDNGLVSILTDGAVEEVGPLVWADYHGDVEFYADNIASMSGDFLSTEDDAPPWSRHYVARFTDGRLSRITGGPKDVRGEHITRAESERRYQATATRGMGGGGPRDRDG